MGWIRIDDAFSEHPKLAAAGPLGWALWMAGLAYANRNLTDGFIPWSVARSLVSWTFLNKDNAGRNAVTNIAVCGNMAGDDVDSEFVIAILVGHGIWDEVDGGYAIHDYLDYQPSRSQVQKERDRNKARQSAFRQRNGRSHAGSNGHRNAVTNGRVTVAPNPKVKENPTTSVVGQKKEARPEGIAQVTAYFQHLKVPNAAEEAERFLAHFEMVGWVYGKSKHPVVDWKAACVTWKKNLAVKPDPSKAFRGAYE